MTDHSLDEKKVRDLMAKMDVVFHGYPRMVIVLACSRSIAAMFGPAHKATREDYLARFPDYMRSMWRVMDEIVQ